MRGLLAGFAIALSMAGEAFAQDVPSPLGGSLPPITVHPSGAEDDGAAIRARQEALSRRLEQSDYAFRSICIRCLRTAEPESTTPFRPYEALRTAPLTPD